MRQILVFLTLLILAGCGRGFSAPDNLDNACAILDERPNYYRAMVATKNNWGVPVHVQMATIYQESRFIGDARTPFRYAFGVLPMGRQSSAFGYSQALNGTWEEYRRSTGNRRARRSDIHDATDFIGWYMARTLARNGVPVSDARNQYLAYHEGHTGYARSSYNAKPWLLRIAGEVAARAQTYQVQLARCRRR